MNTPRIIAGLLATGLVLTTTACQGRPTSEEFISRTLSELAAQAGTKQTNHLSFDVRGDGTTRGGLFAVFVDGKAPKRYFASPRKGKAPEVYNGVSQGSDLQATVDATTLDLAPYLAKAQEYSKNHCAGGPAAVSVNVLVPKTLTTDISCQDGKGGESLLLIDGQPAPVPVPDDPAATVKQFFKYVETYGGPKLDGIFVTRETNGAFAITWNDDPANSATDLVGQPCRRNLVWLAPRSGEQPRPLAASCLGAGPKNGPSLQLSQINADGLAKVMQAAGSSYWIGLQNSGGSPRWDVQSAQGSGPITSYDLNGNKVAK